MLPFLLLLFSFPLLASGLLFNDAAGTVSLTISQGELLGKRIDAYDNRTGYGFLGIPYGAPAVGSLRFAKPQPAAGWDGVRNVTEKGVACPAIGFLTYKVPEGGPMSEDCLHVYVYASKNCLEKGGCAIMWVLHGGRYNFESPINFIDEVIVHNFASDGQDVVVIIPAYRLQNFGFLNIAPGMKTSAVPNVGVWDLLLAMQWTHANAHFFGGDKEKITLFGHSAGAQFADVISSSPHFDGLFRGMILMSGVDTAYAAGIQSNSLASWVTAQILGCTNDGTNRTDIVAVEAVIECLRAKTWEEIVDANLKLWAYPEDYHGPHADGPGGILPLAPSVLARSRKPVPTMIGTTNAEFHDTKFALNANGEADLDKVGELCEAFGYGTGYAKPEVATKLCLDYYVKGKNIVAFEQDTMFMVATYLTAVDMSSRGNDVYLYSFSYQGVGDAFTKIEPLADNEHASHSEDYPYILGMHKGNFTSKDYEIEKIYSGMLLNFVKTGYPVPGAGQPKWKPFSRVSSDYYEIDFDDKLRMPGMKKGYQKEAVQLWAHDIEKQAGPVTPPEIYEHADRFYPMDVVQAYTSHHTGKTTHDKDLESEFTSYQSWKDYVSKKRYERMLELDGYRSIVVEEPLEELLVQDSNFIMNLLIICVSAALIFLLLRGCIHFIGTNKQRKGYERY